MNKDKIIDHIKNCFENAENNMSKISDDIKNLDGMSGLYTRHFYNNLLNIEDARYLEIGSWKGSSVCSAMYQNNATVVCIDDYSEAHGGDIGDTFPVKTFTQNFQKFKGNNNALFINKNCYEVDLNSLPKFNIYMYDGNHSYENHYKALEYFYDVLDDIFIFIVDDWNNNTIRDATYKSIQDLKLNVLYEKEVRNTWDGSHAPQPLAKNTWWNGIYIVLLEKK